MKILNFGVKLVVINKLIAGAKGAEGNSTGAEIAETVNSLVDVSTGILSSVGEKIMEGMASPTPYMYIVQGDSTRNSANNDGGAYYTKQLRKLNFDVINNSKAGQSASVSYTGSGISTLATAISNTDGDGETTILEMSYGINYGSASTIEENEQFISSWISDYLTAKPLATVLLVSPVDHSNGDELESMYTSLAKEHSLVMISGYTATQGVHLDPDYYNDVTHPGYYGNMRLINYILSNIVPLSAAASLSLDELGAQLPSDPVLVTSVEDGYWDSNTGAPKVSANWRRLSAVDVAGGTMLKISNGGNTQLSLLMSNGSRVSRPDYTLVPDTNYGILKIPPNVDEVRINISSDGAAYDASGVIPTIEYVTDDTFILTQSEINKNLPISTPTMINSGVDSLGFTGRAGQSQVADGEGGWLWV